MPIRNLASNTRIRVVTSSLRKNARYRIVATNLSNGKTSAVFEPSRRGKIIKTVPIDARGVVRIEVIDEGGTVDRSYLTVGSSEIDCCIAKLVYDAINCTCKCDKCKEDLKRAQTIRLLLSSAEYEASTGSAESAVDIYNKARALCVEVCACGC